MVSSRWADSLRMHMLPRQNNMDMVKKIKEIGKARNQAKPIKIDVVPDTSAKAKPKEKAPRQRRPDGMERPPEIPRRNNN